jgi:hypothetical protein
LQLFAVIGLALIIVYLAWLRPRYMGVPAPKRPLIVLAVLLMLFGASEARWQYLQWRGSEVVKAVSGNPNGTLECQRKLPSFFEMDSASIAGKVSSLDPNTAHLKNGQCNEIFTWMQSGSPDSVTGKQIVALHVLSHESVHVSGQFSESIAECTALQRDPIAVSSLGGSDEVAQLVQSQYFEQVFPNLPDSYKLKECKVDDKFDSIKNPVKAE